MLNNSKSKVRDVIQVDSELLENISILIEDQAGKSILNIITDLHPADIAEIINHLDLDDATYIFRLLDTETASEVVTELDENLREKILRSIEPQEVAVIVDELDTDDATDIISDLPDPVAEHVLDNIDLEDSKEVKELLKYPEDSAGGIMNSEFVSVPKEFTIAQTIEEVRKHSDDIDNIYHIYILDNGGKLLGITLLKGLLINTLDTPIARIMEEDLIYVTPEIDQEEVANIMEKYDLVALPVVDNDKKMLGRITIDDIVDVIQEEAAEDLQKIAGLSEEQESSDSVFRISRIRLPWLIIALIIELVGAVVLSQYEKFLEELIIATFFIPVVMAMGGSSGTQAAIVMVKGFSSGDIWIDESLKKLSKEFLVALLNGLVCSIILLSATSLFFPSDRVTLSFSILLSVSLFTIIITSTMVGATVPVLFKRLGTDPAIATGPFVTTMNDILGLIIYLTFITLFFVP